MNCKFCNKECKNNNSLRNHERLCKLNPNRQLTTFEKYGSIEGFNKKGRIAWNKGLTKYTSESVANIAKRLSEGQLNGSIKNPMKGRILTDAQKEKISKKMIEVCKSRDTSLCGKGKRGYYKGYYCQSSWELAYVIYNLDHNIYFIRNKKGFSYIIDNIERTYFPDFYLPDTDTYIEVKGYYDRKSKIKTQQFRGNLQILQIKEMKPILDYCKNKYGKDFTYLYEDP